MDPKQRLSARERRRQLLDAAEAVFGRLGWHATRMEDIATEAGVTKSLLFKHWPSKEALYRELRVRLSERLRGRLEEATRPQHSPARAVAALADTTVHFFHEHPGTTQLFSRAAPGWTEESDVTIEAIEGLTVLVEHASTLVAEEPALLALLGEMAATSVSSSMAVARRTVPDLDVEFLSGLITTMVVGAIDAVSRDLTGIPLSGASEFLPDNRQVFAKSQGRQGTSASSPASSDPTVSAPEAAS